MTGTPRSSLLLGSNANASVAGRWNARDRNHNCDQFNLVLRNERDRHLGRAHALLCVSTVITPAPRLSRLTLDQAADMGRSIQHPV